MMGGDAFCAYPNDFFTHQFGAWGGGGEEGGREEGEGPNTSSRRTSGISLLCFCVPLGVYMG